MLLIYGFVSMRKLAIVLGRSHHHAVPDGASSLMSLETTHAVERNSSDHGGVVTGGGRDGVIRCGSFIVPTERYDGQAEGRTIGTKRGLPISREGAFLFN